ncbi:MAG: inositol phosphatase [Planctomycetes bacterium]|nr:inositol phosphatase [Planctomycetota bacterium]
MNIDLEHALETVRLAATRGAEAALRRFRKNIDIELKSDKSVVTIADREAEAAIIDVLRSRFPDHAILGEESGAHERRSPYRWIVDPIDGTLGFSRGSSFWGPLVALEHEGKILAGALGLPALGELYVAARGLGCWNGDRRLRVSSIDTWSDATLSLGELRRLVQGEFEHPVLELCRTAKSARCYGDLAAVTLVLEGRAEAYIEGGVKIWDLAPLPVLLEEAGGRFTDMTGSQNLELGNGIGTNGLVHEYVLEHFRTTPH